MTMRSLMLQPETLSTLKLPQLTNITEQLPRHPSKVWPKRDFNRLEGIIIHHAASEAPIRNQALYHVNAHGWARIGYTHCIQNEQIYQTNWLDDRTTHASGANDIAFGVCIVGDLSKRSITDFERRAVTGLVLMLKKQWPALWVKGHNQVTRTACPCTDMDRIRADIAAAEELLSYNATTPADRAVCYALAERVNDLKAKLTHAVWGTEARRKLSLLATLANGTTAEETADNVLHMYDVAIKSKWGQEETRLLVEVAKYAKQQKVM